MNVKWFLLLIFDEGNFLGFADGCCIKSLLLFSQKADIIFKPLWKCFQYFSFTLHRVTSDLWHSLSNELNQHCAGEDHDQSVVVGPYVCVCVQISSGDQCKHSKAQEQHAEKVFRQQRLPESRRDASRASGAQRQRLTQVRLADPRNLMRLFIS